MTYSLGRLKPLVYTLALLAGFMTWAWSRLPLQDNPLYFQFADERPLFFIPNAQDVLSNFAFLFVAFWGACALWQKRQNLSAAHFYLAGCLALASALTAFGSSYFHWNPNEDTLFYDRMPMTIGFTSICALLIADRISEPAGVIAATVLIPAGLITVVGWHIHALSLRPYAALQLGSLVFLFLLALFQPRGVVKNGVVWSGLGFYVLAKVFEIKDAPLFASLGFVSGHTLKHLAAAAAIFIFFRFPKVVVSRP